MLEIGMKAPDFTLSDQEGNLVSLSSFLGKKVVLYFYPRDNTPGCTRCLAGKEELRQSEYGGGARDVCD